MTMGWMQQNEAAVGFGFAAGFKGERAKFEKDMLLSRT